MQKKSRYKRMVFVVLVVIVAGLAWICAAAFPVISGYGSKNLCSAVYLQHRDPDAVVREDLSDFPLSLGQFRVNEKDQSVTGSVMGFAKRKTIFRPGIGCTLVNGCSEAAIREQSFAVPRKPLRNPDTEAWPHGDQLPATLPPGIHQQRLQAAVDATFDERRVKGKRPQTRAVIVLYEGNIVAEKYAAGFDKSTVMLGWSMSKSITAAMIGILIKQGRLSLDAPAPVPEWVNSPKQSITIRQLLQQTSGIDFLENYTRPSNVTRMLFSEGDMAAYAASLPLAHPPGTRFNYSSGNSNILSRIIRNTVGENKYTAFPYDSLFYPIDAYSFLLEPDASGTFVGSSYSYATARDFARFGLLYYNNGVWNGKQILPVDWVQQTVQPAAADPRKHYGFQFWINGDNEKRDGRRWYPDLPADMFFADGYGGQDVYIIPSEKLVVVRLGLYTIDDNRFLKEVIACFH